MKENRIRYVNRKPKKKPHYKCECGAWNVSQICRTCQVLLYQKIAKQEAKKCS